MGACFLDRLELLAWSPGVAGAVGLEVGESGQCFRLLEGLFCSGDGGDMMNVLREERKFEDAEKRARLAPHKSARSSEIKRVAAKSLILPRTGSVPHSITRYDVRVSRDQAPD